MTAWVPPRWYDRLGGIAWRAVIVVVALALLVSGLVGLSVVIIPMTLGLLFACGLHPLAARLQRHGLNRMLASTVAVIVLVAVIATVGLFTVRAVVDQWGDIVTLIDAGRSTLNDAIADLGVNSETASTANGELGAFVGSIVGLLLGGLVAVVPTVAGVITSLLLSFVVAWFFLKDGTSMWAWIVSRLGESSTLAAGIGDRVWVTLSGYIRGQTVIALCDASLITLGALVLGVPNAGAVFMLTFVGAYIPYIGAFLSGLLAVLLAVGDSGLAAGTAMLLVVLAVQLLEGNVLQPWIQGRAVQLHPLVIALSVTAGGALAGFLGVLLAVPVTAAGFVALSELRTAGILGPLPVPAAPRGTAAPGTHPGAPP